MHPRGTSLGLASLEGKREQCHAQLEGVHAHFRSLARCLLQIVGCCAEADVVGNGVGKLRIVPRRHWPPLISPKAFFYLLSLLHHPPRSPHQLVTVPVPLC